MNSNLMFMRTQHISTMRRSFYFNAPWLASFILVRCLIDSKSSPRTGHLMLGLIRSSRILDGELQPQPRFCLLVRNIVDNNNNKKKAVVSLVVSCLYCLNVARWWWQSVVTFVPLNEVSGVRPSQASRWTPSQISIVQCSWLCDKSAHHAR